MMASVSVALHDERGLLIRNIRAQAVPRVGDRIELEGNRVLWVLTVTHIIPGGFSMLTCRDITPNTEEK